MTRLPTGAAIVALTLAGFLLFPGHTYLQQDTQIYTAILEHLWNPAVLRNDILVQSPHVSFTLYDEVALALRKLTGADFERILLAQQLVFRALGLWGIYLIAGAAGLGRAAALLVTAIWSLGATIVGPSVLTVEYEPTPRGFAVPLIFLAVGLLAQRRPVWAGAAASAAFLLHPPTTYPFWLVFMAMLFMQRKIVSLIPPTCAAAIMMLAAHYQTGVHEQQHFFERIGPELEKLQRMRASYNWVSLWWRDYFLQYAALFAAIQLAWWRTKIDNAVLRWFVVGMAGIGLLSVPVSYVLLEQMKWALMPQLQPARALLFVSGFAMLMAAIAGCGATGLAERFCWFALAYFLPSEGAVLAVVILAAGASLALWLERRGAAIGAVAIGAVAIGAMGVIPDVGRVQNYPHLRTAELAQLSKWAGEATPRDAVFAFPGFGHRLEPGIFRAQALRAVFVDWKGGGQVNYLPELGEQWWTRWQQRDEARAAGVDYFVRTPDKLHHDEQPLFTNSSYSVYSANASGQLAVGGDDGAVRAR